VLQTGEDLILCHSFLVLSYGIRDHGLDLSKSKKRLVQVVLDLVLPDEMETKWKKWCRQEFSQALLLEHFYAAGSLGHRYCLLSQVEARRRYRSGAAGPRRVRENQVLVPWIDTLSA